MTRENWRRVAGSVGTAGPPMALAALECFHPHPPHDLFELDARAWLWIHYLQIPLFPLSALSAARLLRGDPGAVAGVGRVAMFAFGVAYTAFDTAAGVVTGVLLRAAQSSGDPESWRGPIRAVWEHPVIGASKAHAPVLAIFGTLAWLLGLGSAATAVRRAGGPWVPVGLLAVSGLGLFVFRSHAWPGGPLSFGSLAVAAAWLEWSRSRPGPGRPALDDPDSFSSAYVHSEVMS